MKKLTFVFIFALSFLLISYSVHAFTFEDLINYFSSLFRPFTAMRGGTIGQGFVTSVCEKACRAKGYYFGRCSLACRSGEVNIGKEGCPTPYCIVPPCPSFYCCCSPSNITTTVPYCYDSDGLNYYTKGITANDTLKKYDECVNCVSTCSGNLCLTTCNSVKEYYCSQNLVEETIFGCPSICSEGACVKVSDQHILANATCDLNKISLIIKNVGIATIDVSKIRIRIFPEIISQAPYEKNITPECDKTTINPGEITVCQIQAFYKVNRLVIFGPSNTVYLKVYCPSTTTTTTPYCYSDNECRWCGDKCVKYVPSLVCRAEIPPPGLQCKCINNKCQVVAVLPPPTCKDEGGVCILNILGYGTCPIGYSPANFTCPYPSITKCCIPV